MCLAEVNELVLPSLNCAISIPPGWAQIVVPNPNSRAFYKSPDGARTVILEVIEFGDARVEVDERFIAKRKEVENVAIAIDFGTAFHDVWIPCLRNEIADSFSRNECFINPTDCNSWWPALQNCRPVSGGGCLVG